MSFKLRVDKNVWNNLRKELLKGSSTELQVGIVNPVNYGSDNDNLSVAQVWQWQEEGVPSQNIPTRPAIRVGFMTPIKKGLYDSYFIESMQRIAQGKSTFKQEYESLGRVAKSDLKEVVEKWDTPPNAPFTVDEKGFNNPLINTGLLYESIDYKVAKRGDV